MAKYAQYDAAGPSPYPVVGWYDADAIEYPTLPPETVLYAMSDEQWAAHMGNTNQRYAYDGTTLVPYTPPLPPPTADAVLAQKIALGIAITSTSTPELACTMALDATTMDQIGSVARDASSGLGLPGGLPTFTYPDIEGVPRSFTETQLIALYKAQRDLIYVLNVQAAVMRQGGIPVWPEQTATIP